MRPLLLILSLLAATSAYLAAALNASVSTVAPLKVVFLDFDQTLVVGSIGDDVLKRCDPLCLTYNVSTCKCAVSDLAMAKFLKAMPGREDYVNGAKGLGGPERIRRLIRTFDTLLHHNVELRLLSTSWGIISGRQWANFLNTFLSLATPSLANFFPVENIIALRDAGAGKAADKGMAAAKYLASKNWTVHNGILVDESAMNLAKVQGKVDWLHVSPPNGMSQEDLKFLLQRAEASQFSTEVDDHIPLKVVFFNFENTLVTTKVGETIIKQCDAQCLNYSSSSCRCDLANFLENMPTSKEYVIGTQGLGGPQRIRHLEKVVGELKKKNVLLRILSTSWGLIDAKNWAAFIAKYFEIASPILADAFPIERIITLDDPAENIPADIGLAAATFLSFLHWNRHNGLLVDDSPNSIAQAQGLVDWLQVTPRKGIARDALDFLIKRARVGSRPATLAPRGRKKVASERGNFTKTRTQSFSLLVTQTRAYCGGAVPTEEILLDLQIPRPLPNQKLYFYRADSDLQRWGEPEEAVSDSDGRIQINLEPLSTPSVYCVVGEQKSTDLVVPPDDEFTKYDHKCLQKQHAVCDVILSTQNETVSVNFPSYCFWGTPCIHYIGPLPP